MNENNWNIPASQQYNRKDNSFFIKIAKSQLIMDTCDESKDSQDQNQDDSKFWMLILSIKKDLLNNKTSLSFFEEKDTIISRIIMINLDKEGKVFYKENLKNDLTNFKKIKIDKKFYKLKNFGNRKKNVLKINSSEKAGFWEIQPFYQKKETEIESNKKKSLNIFNFDYNEKYLLDEELKIIKSLTLVNSVEENPNKRLKVDIKKELISIKIKNDFQIFVNFIQKNLETANFEFIEERFKKLDNFDYHDQELIKNDDKNIKIFKKFILKIMESFSNQIFKKMRYMYRTRGLEEVYQIVKNYASRENFLSEERIETDEFHLNPILLDNIPKSCIWKGNDNKSIFFIDKKENEFYHGSDM